MAKTHDDNGGSGDGAANDRARAALLREQAERLTALRKRVPDLSQKRLAAALELHVNTIAAWERGLNEISFDNAAMLAAYYGVPLIDVLGRDPPPEAVTPATDKTVRDCFDKVSQRVNELRGDLQPHLERQDAVLDALLLEVRELARLVRGEALPDTDEPSRPSRRAKRGPRGQSHP